MVKRTKKGYKVNPEKRDYTKTRKYGFKGKNQKKQVVELIKKTIQRTAEKKTVRILYDVRNANGMPFYTSSLWGLNRGVFILSPITNRIAIDQGTGQGQRVGNEIMTVKSTIKGIMVYSPYDASYNDIPRPLNIMMIIYKIRANGSLATPVLSGLFNNGNSQSTPDSSLSDLILPINKNLYQVYRRKIFKLAPAINTATGSQANYQNYANNDYKYNIRFSIDVTKYLDKKYIYNDNSVSPENDTVYVAFMPVWADGNVPAVANSKYPFGLTMCQEFTYTDV